VLVTVLHPIALDAVEVKRRADPAVEAPNYEALPPEWFALDREIERERDRHVAFHDEPGATCRDVEHDASEVDPSKSAVAEGDRARLHQDSPLTIRLVFLQDRIHVPGLLSLAPRDRLLKRDEIWMNRHRALASCLSMIFSENRYALFRIML